MLYPSLAKLPVTDNSWQLLTETVEERGATWLTPMVLHSEFCNAGMRFLHYCEA